MIIKHNKRVYNSSLFEVNRKDLVGKTKVQSPDRYVKRLNYKSSNYKGINMDDFLKKDILTIETKVGDYNCIVSYQGVLTRLKDILKIQPKPNVTLQSIIKAMSSAFDDTDIKVDCNCGDFVYRFAYWATKFGYKYGKPENRPAKITNPKDKKGAMCKHLTSLLSNKRWLVKVASIVNDYIKQNSNLFRDALGLSDDEFIVNKSHYYAGKKTPHNRTNLKGDNSNVNSNNRSSEGEEENQQQEEENS